MVLDCFCLIFILGKERVGEKSGGNSLILFFSFFSVVLLVICGVFLGLSIIISLGMGFVGWIGR